MYYNKYSRIIRGLHLSVSSSDTARPERLAFHCTLDDVRDSGTAER